ncbi:hypothetical protein [Allopontixanthobacter sp.]|uniref:hypothetical protein n=1 Tax=Allopontixanthobacter sp. TaxID=2906452 RepID=UPI002ABA1E6C|nr:hypothetical protein [Allopontixanthobacter sp.]MDZ4308417.1 hypothetical protein [Allopontixanthobacter sp.]
MKGHLYVVDELGNEIEGSRRSVAHCKDVAGIADIRRELEAACGEGCMVLDSEVDRLADRE